MTATRIIPILAVITCLALTTTADARITTTAGAVRAFNTYVQRTLNYMFPGNRSARRTITCKPRGTVWRCTARVSLKGGFPYTLTGTVTRNGKVTID